MTSSPAPRLVYRWTVARPTPPASRSCLRAHVAGRVPAASVGAPSRRDRSAQVVRDVHPDEGGVDRELFKSMVESRSEISANAGEAIAALREVRRELAESYSLIEDSLQGVLRTPICGVGMPDAETAVRIQRNPHARAAAEHARLQLAILVRRGLWGWPALGRRGLGCAAVHAPRSQRDDRQRPVPRSLSRLGDRVSD